MDSKYNNVEVEGFILGVFSKSFDLFCTYKDKIDIDVHITDAGIAFYYKLLCQFYATHSDKLDRTKMDMFIIKNEKYQEVYEKYGGYDYFKVLSESVNSKYIVKYIDELQKYAIIRTMVSKKFPVDNLMAHKSFPDMSSQDLINTYRNCIDKVSELATAMDETEELADNLDEFVDELIAKPDMGIPMSSELVNSISLGLRPHLNINIQVSNSGKSRWLVFELAYMSYLLGKSTVYLSNEMGLKRIRKCLLVTMYNNEMFHELFDFKVVGKINERDMSLGRYKNKNGIYIDREVDEFGVPVISDDEFLEVLRKQSPQYNCMKKVAKFIKDNNMIMFKLLNDYSDESLLLECRKAKTGYNADIVAYDTMKPHIIGEWSLFAQTATTLDSFAVNNDLCIIANVQATDSAREVDIHRWTTMEIADAKSIYRVTDFMQGSKLIPVSDFDSFIIRTKEGKFVPLDQEQFKGGWKLKATKVMKVRDGEVDLVIAHRINLNTNEYQELGFLEIA